MSPSGPGPAVAADHLAADTCTCAPVGAASLRSVGRVGGTAP